MTEKRNMFLTSARSPYDVLGIRKEATDEEIDKAYKKLARKYHPDKNSGSPDATEKFKEIHHARQILKTAQRKRIYELVGDPGVKVSEQFDNEQVDDWIEKLFTGWRLGFTLCCGVITGCFCCCVFCCYFCCNGCCGKYKIDEDYHFTDDDGDGDYEEPVTSQPSEETN